MNFTEQAQLFERSLTDDKRTALGYEPCERCRLRGTRCSQCKAIRTGGGYIILDAGADPTSLLNRRRKGYGMCNLCGHVIVVNNIELFQISSGKGMGQVVEGEGGEGEG